jgi:hypothetical protein
MLAADEIDFIIYFIKVIIIIVQLCCLFYFISYTMCALTQNILEIL